MPISTTPSLETTEPLAGDDRLLRCPACFGSLAVGIAGARCDVCAVVYPATPTGLDLRPKHRLARVAHVPAGVAPPDLGGRLVDRLPRGRGLGLSAADIDAVGLTYGNRMSSELASHLEVVAGDTVLDLGCGSRAVRRLLEPRGVHCVETDYNGDAPYLADAHALPFADDCFDGIVSLAVLEHVRSPHLVMQEAARVLRPGATIIGTSAFLEVFHMDSHFHTTALGVVAALEDAGFENIVLAPTPEWDLGAVLADMDYLPGVRGPARRALRFFLTRGHRVLWGRLRRGVPDVERRATFAAGFQFAARKPIGAG